MFCFFFFAVVCGGVLLCCSVFAIGQGCVRVCICVVMPPYMCCCVLRCVSVCDAILFVLGCCLFCGCLVFVCMCVSICGGVVLCVVLRCGWCCVVFC